MFKILFELLIYLILVRGFEEYNYIHITEDDNNILGNIQHDISYRKTEINLYNLPLVDLTFGNVSFKNAKSREKLCNFRNFGLYPTEYMGIYPFDLAVTGYCYNYTNPKLFYPEKLKVVATFIPTTKFHVLRGITTVDGKLSTFYFDMYNKNVTQIIKNSFKSEDLYQKFLECRQSAISCCDNQQNKENIHPTENYPCYAMWDGWSCIDRTKNYETAYNICPTFISESTICTANSEKYCVNNKWNHTTNYAPCTFSEMLRKRHTFHIIALSISTVIIFPCILIFTCFRSFKDGKHIHVILHRNLLVSLVVRNILTITSKESVIIDALLSEIESNNVMVNNSVGCRVLSYLENVSKNAIFTCMLVDAYYLHKIIVRAFAKDPKIYVLYGFTLFFSLLPSTVWAILMGVEEMGNCWMVDDVTWYQWVTDGYKYCVLAINTLLLIHILIVLLQKCGKNANKQQSKSALRATMFMLPLFGIPHLFMSQRDMVDITWCSVAYIYYRVIYSIDALQGILVAVLFCYMNGEVQMEMKKLFNRLKQNFREKFYFSESPSSNSKRRTTTMTNVMESCRGSNCSINPDFPRSTNNNIEDWMSRNTFELKDNNIK